MGISRPPSRLRRASPSSLCPTRGARQRSGNLDVSCIMALHIISYTMQNIQLDFVQNQPKIRKHIWLNPVSNRALHNANITLKIRISIGSRNRTMKPEFEISIALMRTLRTRLPRLSLSRTSRCKFLGYPFTRPSKPTPSE